MSRLMAYVPLIEGFGLPPVEAMAFGAPVVASPLPSTAGAAFEVDPHSIDSIAAGLLSVATDDGQRARLRALGSARSAELTWAAIARRHVAVWDQWRAETGRARG
jgi:glycosyltransferase involved in cell wall biosynthesis